MKSHSNPYQAPSSESAAEPEFLVFTTEFFRQWLVLGIGVSAISIVFMIVDTPGTQPFPFALASLLCFLLAFTLGAAGAALLVGWFKVYICERGIKAFDFWGIYSFVPWTSINGVKKTSFLGLPYLRVFADPLSRPFWLPLFLVQKKDFWTCVSTWVTDDSPLAEVASAQWGKSSPPAEMPASDAAPLSP